MPRMRTNMKPEVITRVVIIVMMAHVRRDWRMGEMKRRVVMKSKANPRKRPHLVQSTGGL